MHSALGSDITGHHSGYLRWLPGYVARVVSMYVCYPMDPPGDDTLNSYSLALEIHVANISAVCPRAPRAITASAASRSTKVDVFTARKQDQAVAFMNALRLAAHRDPVIRLTTLSPLSLNYMYTVHFVVGLRKKHRCTEESQRTLPMEELR